VRRLRALAATTALLVLAGCGGGDEPAAAPTAAVDGCDVAAPGSDGPADHLDPAEAPPAEELYEARPSVGGQHFGEWLRAGVYDAPVEERAAVHNLEHGAIAVYHDPDLPADELDALTDWAEDRNDAGLLDERSGAGLIVAPWEGALDPPIAYRGWGVQADCESFDAGFADGFVRDHFGEAGDAPEGSFGGDPSRVVGRAADV
jgi:hypothetical protein